MRFREVSSIMAKQYIEAADKIVNKGKHLKVTMDIVPKNMARALSYVFADWTDQFETICLFSDACTITSMETREKFEALSPEKFMTLQINKLSVSSMDNVRIFREMKSHLKESKILQQINFTGIYAREEAWQVLSEGILRSNSMQRIIIQHCNLAEKNNLGALLKGLRPATKLESIDL